MKKTMIITAGASNTEAAAKAARSMYDAEMAGKHIFSVNETVEAWCGLVYVDIWVTYRLSIRETLRELVRR